MFRSLLWEARIWPLVWRRRLALYWHIGEKDNLIFFAMLGLPFIALGLISHSVYTDRMRIDAIYQMNRALELRCLAENIYFEARGEPLSGQYAVADVTLNRLASRHFPNTICEVVHDTRWDQKRRRFTAHFSWTQLEFRSEPSGPAWEQAMEVATAVYDGTHRPVVPNALFYHANTVQPYWAGTKRLVTKIGNHIFYR